MSLKLVDQNGNEIDTSSIQEADVIASVRQMDSQETEMQLVLDESPASLEQSLGAITMQTVERLSKTATLMGSTFSNEDKQHYASVIFTTLTNKMIFSLMQKAGFSDAMELLEVADIQEIEDSLKSFFEYKASQERAMMMQAMEQQKNVKKPT